MESGHHARFMRLSGKWLPFLSVTSVLLLGLALILVVLAPSDYQHGVTGKILYIHVPSAWGASFCYVIMVLAAVHILMRPRQISTILLLAIAPVGAGLTALTLITGSLWGRPAWGTWWVWDARLTSVLVLFLLYCAIIALSRAYEIQEKSASAAAILTLFGWVNLPIIKFSVTWWHSLHQPSSLWREDGIAIETAMLWPLFAMAVAFLSLLVVLGLLAMRGEILSRQRQHLQICLAQQARAAQAQAQQARGSPHD